MALLLKLVKGLGKFLAALVSLFVILYLLLVLINWQDEAPSEAAITLQQLQQSVAPDVEQSADNNGYLFLQQYELQGEYQLSEPLAQLLRQCNITECNAVLMAQPELALWIAQHQDTIDFYQQVRSFTAWYELIPADAAATLPSFRSLLNGQRLLLVQAWLAAQQQDTEKVQLLLQQDMQFWRSLQPKHNMLLTKLIGAEAIKRHFNFAQAIRQQLSAQQYAAIRPQSWLSPFTEQELSLLQAMSGEWAFSNNVTETLLLSDTATNDLSAVDKLEWLILKPLFQSQASRNQLAGMLLAQVNGHAATEPTWYSWLYNPVGKVLNSMTVNYVSYHARLAQLETLRQQAIL
ncbi:hypothetical protein E0Z06_02830 [Rheinheimera sp. D18]|uniref:hypothetical protein n=1 Tax=Rheinheimera sp. D18 TaxID=2545632 RepID=UPI00104DF56B|nr:hypothetical protein [Rheinheimera sp. D18]QBL08523.1 hypothetical protein E0Z06_02830 [Rheinheimera sp. D18]